MYQMKIKAEFEVCRLHPWILYRPEPGFYVFVIDEEADVHMEEDQDNFVIINGASSAHEALETFIAACNEGEE